MHAVQAKVWPHLGNYTLTTLSSVASDLQNATKGTLARRYPWSGRGVALWLECGCAVSINAPLMMTCNAMQARQKTRSELHASPQPLHHSRTNANVILVYNSINGLVIASQKRFCCRILTTAVKSLQVELRKQFNGTAG